MHYNARTEDDDSPWVYADTKLPPLRKEVLVRFRSGGHEVVRFLGVGAESGEGHLYAEDFSILIAPDWCWMEIPE